MLHCVADAIEDHADDIAVLECIDTGQAHRFMAKAAIRAAENFRFFADRCAEARDGLNMPSEEHWNISTRVPIGPVGVITPWNTPFMLSTWKIAPALAAGCTVVHKPAEWSPVTADLLSKLAKQAGLPDGVLNTVHGMGEEAGKALTEHPAIKAIGFVGEKAEILSSPDRSLGHEAVRLAGIDAFEHGNIVGAILNRVGHPVQQFLPHRCRHVAPGFEGSRGCDGRTIDVFGVAARH